MKERRVVVAGMGIASALGSSMDEISDALKKGTSCIIVSDERKEKGFRSPLTTSVFTDDPKYKLDRRARKYMPEAARLGALAWLRALDQCGLNAKDFEGPDVGIIIGNDSTAEPLHELIRTLDTYKDTHYLGSKMVIKTMTSTCSMNLGPLIKAQGINITISGACASGSHAVGYGYNLIKTGMQEAVIAGGVQELNWLSMSSFDALGAFSIHEDPALASRPFDHERDGLVPGGGGAILILEELERAKKLGHPIYGEIISYGFSSDGEHLTQPSGEGAEVAMKKALSYAKLSPHDIDYISAHATSTPVGDRAEAIAIHNIFGEKGPFVSSTKSMTGHESWMSGTSELIYCLLMIRDNFIAPNINFEKQEEGTPKINITGKTIDMNVCTALSNSFGFGGTNSCIIVKEFQA